MALNKLLLVDDDRDALESLARALQSALGQNKDIIKLEILLAYDTDKALKLAEESNPAVAVIDLSIDPKRGVESGYQLLRDLITTKPTMQVIVLTGHGDTEFGVRAIELGARNFLVKPADINHLATLIIEAKKYHLLLEQLNKLKTDEAHRKLNDQLVGQSKAISNLRQEIAFAASSNQPVLILGETGSGKGLCARLIHQTGGRKERPLIRYQPGLSRSDVLASELFGHRQGAFTGAESSRDGILKKANLGTFFLDEIDGLPIETQTALLGVLQEKTFRAVGADEEEQIDVRFIAATNANPETLKEAGTLRADFYHRIAHLQIVVPPLKKRIEDIPLLTESIIKGLVDREEIELVEFSDDAILMLQSYNWPGNVRELEAVVQNGAFRARFEGEPRVEPKHITITKSSDLQKTAAISTESNQQDLHSQVREFKRSIVEAALKASQGNQVQASKQLGIDRTTLRRILVEG